MSLKKISLAAALALGMMGGAMAASPVAYPNPGTANPHWVKFVAQNTGPITAYYIGGNGKYEENLRVASKGQWLGGVGQSNRHLHYGDQIIFGYANAGDEVSLFLSIPSINAGVWSQKILIAPNAPATPNGIYATQFPGDASAAIPPGVYVGFEEQAVSFGQTSDWDYNDSEYVFTNLRPVADE